MNKHLLQIFSCCWDTRDRHNPGLFLTACCKSWNQLKGAGMTVLNQPQTDLYYWPREICIENEEGQIDFYNNVVFFHKDWQIHIDYTVQRTGQLSECSNHQRKADITPT